MRVLGAAQAERVEPGGRQKGIRIDAARMRRVEHHRHHLARRLGKHEGRVEIDLDGHSAHGSQVSALTSRLLREASSV